VPARPLPDPVPWPGPEGCGHPAGQRRGTGGGEPPANRQLQPSLPCALTLSLSPGSTRGSRSRACRTGRWPCRSGHVKRGAAMLQGEQGGAGEERGGGGRKEVKNKRAQGQVRGGKPQETPLRAGKSPKHIMRQGFRFCFRMAWACATGLGSPSCQPSEYPAPVSYCPAPAVTVRVPLSRVLTSSLSLGSTRGSRSRACRMGRWPRAAAL